MSTRRRRGDAASRIRKKYGRGRRGRSFADIGREFGVSRQLAHAVLSRPAAAAPTPRGRPAPRAGARPFVLRLPAGLHRAVRLTANARGTTVSAVAREAIASHLRGRTRKDAA